MTIIKSTLKALAPAPVMNYYRACNSVRTGAAKVSTADDIAILPLVCPRDCIALDVGANMGTHTVALRRLTKHVHAFEPIPSLAKRLRTAFLFDRRVTVHEIALSDRYGTTRLRTPIHNGKPVTGLSTINTENKLSDLPYVETPVMLMRLDDMRLPGRVGFIKIDVEGNELAVLRGAAGTISRDQPTIFVEAAEWHRPGAARSVIEFMREHGYKGYFLWSGHLYQTEIFNPIVHQRDDTHDELGRQLNGTQYASMFLFQPSSSPTLRSSA